MEVVVDNNNHGVLHDGDVAVNNNLADNNIDPNREDLNPIVVNNIAPPFAFPMVDLTSNVPEAIRMSDEQISMCIV